MGLLEDAIREHLDLKRRRGADADEVAQAERDALGPPGRPTPLEETAAAALDQDEAPYEGDETDFDDAYEPDEVPAEERLDPAASTRLYDYGADDEADIEETEILEEDVHDEPVFIEEEEAPAPTGSIAASALEEPETVVVPAPEAPEPPAPAPAPEDAADEDEAPPGEGEGEGEGEESEDPLEETPDFLQETPEHDRLWFEQKPPRDFDFGN